MFFWRFFFSTVTFIKLMDDIIKYKSSISCYWLGSCMTSLAKPAKILAPCSECAGSVMISNCWCSQVGAFAPSGITRSGIMVPLMIATPIECIQECAWVTPRIITRSVPIQEWNIVSERYTYSKSKFRLPLTPLWTLLMSHVQPFVESVWFDGLSLENRHSWC